MLRTACRASVLIAVAAIGATAGAQTPSWEVALTTNSYVFPGGDDDFTLGIGTADHGPWHLEVRYNYEALDTVSLWLGWNLSFGETVAVGITPMAGFAFGDLMAPAPGLEMSVEWWRLDAYAEGEVVIDLENSADGYAYLWSEIAVTPWDWLRVGLVGQRTRVYETERDIQRGALAQVMVGPATVGAYWFNPGADDWIAVVALGIDFEAGGGHASRRPGAFSASPRR